MTDRLITREDVELELEDRELEETWGPSCRMREVLEEFAAVGRQLGRREWHDPTAYAVIHRGGKQRWHAGDLPHLSGGGNRKDPAKVRERELVTARAYAKRQYAALKADPAKYSAWLAYRREYVRRRRQEDPGFVAQMRSCRNRSYAHLKADREYVRHRSEKARKRYAAMREDPAQRERYDRVLKKARERSERRWKQQRER